MSEDIQMVQAVYTGRGGSGLAVPATGRAWDAGDEGEMPVEIFDALARQRLFVEKMIVIERDGVDTPDDKLFGGFVWKRGDRHELPSRAANALIATVNGFKVFKPAAAADPVTES
jgi:hypothetical protein